MTINQAPESNRNVYDSCDPTYLRELREASGMDLLVLARTACLSVAQVRQLESHDSDGLFYSDAIKRQAYKRVLMILGAEPPTVQVPQALLDAAKVAGAHGSTLDQIVSMSEQPSMSRTTSDLLHAALEKLKSHKQAWAALALFVSSVTLLVLHGPLDWVDVSSAPTSASSTAVADEVASTATTLIASSPASSAALAEVVGSAPSPAASLAAPSAMAAVLAASAPMKSGACAYSSDSMPQLGPFVAQKEGRYVYLVSAVNADVCVVDANKQATWVQLKAGEGRSVYGTSPWQISSANLQKVQIFFQGGRVTLPDPALNRVSLVEVPVAR